MFPLLQLQLASNILRSDTSEDVMLRADNKIVDPSVFSIENYSAVLPLELSGKINEPQLRKIPVEKSEYELTISDIPKDLSQIRVFSNTKEILPLKPGQLGIIEEGSRNKGAFFMTPSSELDNRDCHSSSNQASGAH